MTDETKVADEAEADAATSNDTTPTSFSKVKRRRGTSKATTVIAAILLAGVAGTLAYYLKDEPEPERSRMTKGPQNIDGTPAGDQLTQSPEYQATLLNANLSGATSASETPGQSFIATPDQPIEENPLPEKRVAQAPTLPPPNKVEKVEPKIIYRDRIVKEEVPVKQAPPPPPAQPDWQSIQALAKGMGNQAGDVARAGSPKGTNLKVLVEQELYESPEGSAVGVDATRSRRPNSQGNDSQSNGAQPLVAPLTSNFQADLMTTSPYYSGQLEREPSLPVNVGRKLGSGVEMSNGDYFAAAGDLNMAVILNGSDTDTPGPIVARLLKGPLKGAKLIGTFAPNRETTAMIVTFNRVILQDGTNINAEAYAIDARTASLPVKSSYSGRYLQRYGPMLAGAFLEGFGKAIGDAGTQIVSTEGATIITQPQQTTEEALYSGVGQVGETFGGEVSDLGPDGPIVTLNAGKLIGVLFMENVEKL